MVVQVDIENRTRPIEAKRLVNSSGYPAKSVFDAVNELNERVSSWDLKFHLHGGGVRGVSSTIFGMRRITGDTITSLILEATDLPEACNRARGLLIARPR